jgi:hypothetical protein
MASFIDKIGEKITSGANAVSNSTKKVTETAKINSEISRNSSEIDKLMKKIGVCVKSRLMSQISDPEVEQLASEIDKLIARNEQLSEELKAVKGIRHCTSCGGELDSSCVFCPNCGTKNDPVDYANAAVQSQSAPKAVVKVKAVSPVQNTEIRDVEEPAAPVDAEQAENAEATQFTVNAQETVVEPVIEPVIEPKPFAAQQTASQGLFCPNCGYHETPDAVFCSNCGTKLIN